MEGSRVGLDEIGYELAASNKERHCRLDNTIRQFRSSGKDQYLGVLRRQLPDKVQRLTVSVLEYTAGHEQVSRRTRHHLSWSPDSQIAFGTRYVTESIDEQSEVMVLAKNFREAPEDYIDTDQILPYMIPSVDKSNSTFDRLEQQMYFLTTRLGSNE